MSGFRDFKFGFKKTNFVTRTRDEQVIVHEKFKYFQYRLMKWVTRRSQLSQECHYPRRQRFCASWPWPLGFDHLTPKEMGFQESWWNISVSSLVIQAASVFEIPYGKKNREINTNATKNPTVGVSSNLCWTVIDCDTFGMLFTVITRTVWCVRVLRERAWMLMSPTRLLRSATPWKRSSDVSHQTWQVA